MRHESSCHRLAVLAGLIITQCGLLFAQPEQWMVLGEGAVSPTPTFIPTPTPSAFAQIVSTSPANGETQVALTRETVIEFSAPLQLSTMTAASVSVSFSGIEIPARVQPSFDRRAVSLFFLRQLPESAAITVTIRGDLLLDLGGQPVDADDNGTPGGTRTFRFTTVPLATVPDTSVVGRVFASELMPPSGLRKQDVNRPLAGVKIFVEGAEDRLHTVTDTLGNFTLEDVPAGEFFVYIDGRTVTTTPEGTPTSIPNGPYYPFVGKRWSATAGRETSVGDIYLPLIAPGTMHIVSNTQSTVVEFPASVLAEHPELEGVQIIVPPNALYSDDGQRGGRVGIAPVPPDRIPSPLPEGLNLPIVITVQTDGPSNFDEPVPVCFPNVDNPNTPENELLEPGAKSALWSFDHDTGNWDIVGTLTVNPDGTLICSDPGVGIREPGWHGSAPAGKNDKKKVPQNRDRKPDGPPPCNEPDQEEPVDLTDQMDQLMSDATACLASTSEAQDTIACRSSNNRSLRDASRYAQNVGLPNLVSDPSATQKDYDDFCAALNSRLQRHLDDTSDCGNFFQALNKLRDAAACLDAVQQDSRQTCGKAQAQAGGCKPPQEVGDACNALDNAKRRGDDLRNQANRAEDANERTVGERERLQSIADSLCGGGKSASAPKGPDVLLTEEQRLFIAATIGEFVSQADLVEQLYAEESLPLESMDGAWSEVARARELMNTALLTYFTESSDEPRYFLLEAGAIERRFVFPGPDPALFLPGDAHYVLSWFDATTFETGVSVGVTAPIGQKSFIEAGTAVADGSPDSDGDGLTDFAENIIGTSPADTDTDGDGVSDAEEIRQGTNPADGLALRAGIIASSDTPGFAQDVVALNNLVAVADGGEGVTLFNVFAGFTPVRVGQIDTPGTAERVALSASLLAIADGNAGVHFADVRNAPNATINVTVSPTVLGGFPTAVQLSGALAFVATSTGSIVAIDTATGTLLGRYQSPEGIADLTLLGDSIAIVSYGGRLSLHRFDGIWHNLDVLTVDAIGPLRLFAGVDNLYSSTYNGYTSLDASDPENLAILGTPGLLQNGFRQLALNGSGLGVAPAAIANPSGIADLDLFDASDPAITTAYLTTFETPGDARAVSIYNGLAYVADGGEGLQVVNYIAADILHTSPTITLRLNSSNTEENKPFLASAIVSDDVQVRQVEFYRDGVRGIVDGNYPFEWRLNTPRLSDATSFRIRARAFDTGGNFTWSDEVEVQVVADATPPHVTGMTPKPESLNGETRAISIFFSEEISDASITAGALTLHAGGPDGRPNTGDDVPVSIEPGSISIRGTLLSIAFTGGLPPDVYTVRVSSPAADLAGNLLAPSATWSFAVFNVGADADGDCLPDAVEGILGYDPLVRDTDGNGTEDGAEDNDADTISNCVEVLLGFDTTLADSDGDGVPDKDEDRDNDMIPDAGENSAGTDVNDPDSDDDGFADGEEILDSTNPLSAASFPVRRAAIPPHAASLPVTAENSQPPAFDPALLQHAVSGTFSVLQQDTPRQNYPYAVSPMLSIENTNP